MTRTRRHFILALTLLLIALIGGSWGAYLHTQTVLSRQLAHLATQSLPSDGPTPTLSIQNSQASGWPFGAWRTLYGVAFHTHLNGADLAGATPTLRLGGNWLDWALALTTRQELPLQLPQGIILRMVRHGESLTLHMNKTRLRISRGSIPCPPTALCPHGTLPLYRAHFHIAGLELASSRLPYRLTLLHIAGMIRFAPQSLSHPDPALQNRALLSAALTAEELRYPSSWLQNFRIRNVSSKFALLPYAASPMPPQLHKDPDPTDHENDNNPAWPDISLRLRVHELSATIHPPTQTGQEAPPPHISLGGDLYVPAFSGMISVSLTNWQGPLHGFLTSAWFQHNIPPSTQSLLDDMMNSPRMLSLASHPLTVTIPLDHGVPPGLSSERLQTLYDRLHQLAPSRP